MRLNEKMITLEKYQNEINQICLRYNVKKLTIFGSALSEQFNESSDIDFLLELESAEGGIKKYMNIKFELEKLFTRPVDLVMPKAKKSTPKKIYLR